MTPFAIFAADLHLAQRTRASFPTMCGDAYFGLRQLVDLANEKQLPLVFCGDIFDKAMVDSYTLQVYIDELSRLDPKLCVYAVEGDHELASPRWFEFSKRAVALADAPVTLNGVNLVGVDFQRVETLPEKLQAAAAVFKRKDYTVANTILVTHEGWTEMRQLGHTEGKFSDVHTFELMVSGDFHTPGIWNGTNAAGAPLSVYSPGATCMQSVSEVPEKWALEGFVDTDAGGLIGFKPIPLKTRPFFKMQITDNESEEAHLAHCWRLASGQVDVTGLPPELHMPFVYIETQIELHQFASELRKLAKQLHLQVVYRAPKDIAALPEVSTVRVDAQTNMTAAVTRRASNEQLQADALALWQTETPAEVVAAIRKRVADDAIKQT